MHTGISLSKTLPASSLDQPASRQFHLPVSLWISHQIGVFAFKLSDQSRCHQRVLEKAAGITEHRRIRKLLAANTANSLTDIAGGRMADALFSQALANRAVFEVQMLDATQGQAHPQNQPTPGLLLEQAVAVGEFALLPAEIPQLASLTVQRG